MVKPGKRPKLLHATRRGRQEAVGTSNRKMNKHAFEAVCRKFRRQPGEILWKLLNEGKIGSEFEAKPLVLKRSTLTDATMNEWYEYALRNGIGIEGVRHFRKLMRPEKKKPKAGVREKKEKKVMAGKNAIPITGRRIIANINGVKMVAARKKDKGKAILLWRPEKSDKIPRALYRVNLNYDATGRHAYQVYDYNAGAYITSIMSKLEIVLKLVKLFKKFFP